MKIFQQAILTALIISTLTVQAQENIPQENIKLNEKEGELHLKKGETTYFTLPIEDNYQEGDDLIIKIVPLDYTSQPQTVQNPNENTTSWWCGVYDSNTCFIHNKNVSKGDNFYIAVSCLDEECNLQVDADISQEIYIDDGVEFQSYLPDQEVKVFNYIIPTGISLYSSVVIKASAFRGTVHDFKLSITSEDPSFNSSEDTLHGIQAWKKGQVIRVNSLNFKGWCLGCKIQILLDVKDQGYYHIMAQSEDSEPFLQNEVQRDDIVGKDETNCYRYYVKSDESEVQVRLTTYSGLVNVMAHPSLAPLDSEQFIFKRKDEIETILDLTPFRRKEEASQPMGLYYICVEGTIFSSYTIKVKEFMQIYTLSILEDGYSEEFTLESKQMQSHLYKVPKLDYKGEDIKIEFDLTPRRGGDPTMGAVFCDILDVQQCVVKMQQLTKKNSKYQKAISTGQMLKLVIDHKEILCDEDSEGENCHYVIAVVNPYEHKVSYKIVVTNMQNNHKLLQESVPIVDSVEMKEYQYYKFSLLDDSDVNNIDFRLNKLHGNSDMFISLNQPWPVKDEYEYRSYNVGSEQDTIKITKQVSRGNQSLIGTYHVAVYGNNYTTFSLSVMVNRNHSTDLVQTLQGSTIIYEGVPHLQYLNNLSEQFYGHFEVEIAKQDDQSIIIDVQNLKHKTLTYIKHGSFPSILDYDFMIKEGVQEIKPTDQGYHKTGVYFLMTIPNSNFTKFIESSEYELQISWRYQNMIPHLNSNGKLSISQVFKEHSYLRHYVMDQTQNIKLSVFSKTADNTNIYVSVKSNNRLPTKDAHDFTVQSGQNYKNAKTLLININEIIQINPSCQDLGYAEEEICALYIGVVCLEIEGCESQIELDYQDAIPKKIHYGEVKFSSLEIDEQVYYYTVVNENSIEDLYIQLNVYQGEAEFYVSYQNSFDDSVDHNLLNKPDTKIYQQKSEKILKNNVMHITKEDLTACTKQRINQDDLFNDCILIFGIFPTNQQQNNITLDFTTNSEIIIYDFVVQKGLIEVYNQKPVHAKCLGGQFTYFIYEEICSNCTIKIVIDSYQQQDLLLFVNKGMSYPTQTRYDFKKNMISSDVLTISIYDDIFTNSLMDSIADYYVIGVYSEIYKNFEISITSQEIDVMLVVQDQTVKMKQDQNQSQLFSFFNWQSTDLQFNLKVSSGSTNIYVKPAQLDQIIEDKLTYNKSDYTWSVYNINSLTSEEESSILILKEDRDYCNLCYYYILVQTDNYNADYSFAIHQLQAEKEVSSLIRIGSNEMVNLKGIGTRKILEFMIELDEMFVISPNVLHGQVMVYLNTAPSTESAYYQQKNPSMIIIPKDLIKTGKLNYIILEAVTDQVEMFVKINQKMNIENLHEGMPHMISYGSMNEIAKYMTYTLPIGYVEVRINVQTKINGFHPKLAYALVNQTMIDQGIFPPSELIQYYETSLEDWDVNTFQMSLKLDLKNVEKGQILQLNLQYQREMVGIIINESYTKSMYDKIDTSAQAIITVSHKLIQKIMPRLEYFYTLTQLQPMLFKINPPENKTTFILLSDCKGFSTLSLVRNPQDLQTNRIQIDVREAYGQKYVLLNNLVGEYYVVVEQQQTEIVNELDFETEFVIKYKYLDKSVEIFKEDYVAYNGGKIDFNFIRGTRGDINITWGDIYHLSYGQVPQKVTNVRYKLVLTQEKNVQMTHVCTLKHLKETAIVFDEANDHNKYIATIDADEAVQFNVFAVLQNQLYTVPYTPVTLKVPRRTALGSYVVIIVIASIIVLSCAIAYYFYLKSKMLQKRINEELRDINSSQGPDDESIKAYHKVGGQATQGFHHLTEDDVSKIEEQQ